MLSKIRSRLTYANVTATLALFLALSGGVAFAVTQLDPNSVRSRHIVNGQVKQKDLAPLPVDTSLDSGGFPPETTFKSHGGKLLIFASGSAFRSSNTFGEMAVVVKLDGSLIDVAQFFTNEKNSHRSFVDAVTVVRRVSSGSHSLELEPVSDSDCGTGAETTNTVCTTTNSDDYFEASVLELPD